MRYRCLFVPLFLPFLISSCRAEDEGVFVPSACVQEIVSDKSLPEYSVLSSYTCPDRNGGIAVLGCIDRCLSFTQILLDSDLYDNVSGNAVCDGLPDFAGEKIVSFHTAYDGTSSDSLTVFSVSQYLCALDTVYHLSPYDLEGLGHKNRAKLLIFSEPSCCISVKKDVEYLSNFFCSTIPVIFPLEETLRKCLNTVSAESVSIGFICDSTGFHRDAYEHALEEVASECGKTVNNVFLFVVPDGCPEPLVSFMDAYIADADACPLDAVIIDSYVSDMSGYEDACMNIRSVLSPESLMYGKFLSEDFSVFGVYENTAAVCFRIMREMNLFTHNIAFPYSESFCIVEHPDPTKHTYISVPYVI